MDINPKQKEFFDQHAEVWDTITVHDMDKVGRIASLLELAGNERILDVGTGTGVMIPVYEKYLNGGNVVAIDYSDKMIEMAKAKYPGVKHPAIDFKVANLYDMRETDYYDVIVCYSCFPHFPDKSGALSLFVRALKKGGKLMVAHSCSRDRINQVHREGGEVIEHDYLPKMSEMSRLFIDAGTEVVFTRDDNDYYIIIGKKK